LNKWFVAIAFSVLLLVPVGTQQVLANHPTIPGCPSPGFLIIDPGLIASSPGPPPGSPFCQHSAIPSSIMPTCQSPYVSGSVSAAFPFSLILYNACIAPTQQIQDTTLPDQCQNGAVFLFNHCVPDILAICADGTIPDTILFLCNADNTALDAALTALAEAQAQRDAILTTLFEFLRVFGVI